MTETPPNEGGVEALVTVAPVEAEDVIPTQATALLPLSEEALSEWGKRPDVHAYLSALYEHEISVKLEGKAETTRLSTFMADHILERERELMPIRIAPFNEQAERAAEQELHEWHVACSRAEAAGREPPPGPPSPTEFEPEKSPKLGRVLKGLIAWSGTVQSLLEESNFFSIGHVLETERDLEASITLASNGHYRQACQILRGFIESSVVPLHFCLDLAAFAAWKTGSYRIPPLRGSRGLLRQLEDQGVLSSTTSRQTSDLYAVLNEFVHGAERTLALSGVYEGEETRGFRIKHFEEWADHYSEAVRIGVLLLRATVIEWARRKPDTVLMCNTCHRVDTWEVTARTIAGEEMISFVCSVCGSIQNKRPGDVTFDQSDPDSAPETPSSP